MKHIVSEENGNSGGHPACACRLRVLTFTKLYVVAAAGQLGLINNQILTGFVGRMVT